LRWQQLKSDRKAGRRGRDGEADPIINPPSSLRGEGR